MSSENKDERKTVNGLVTEALPNTMFRVRLDDSETKDSNKEIIAYLAGKMRMHRIKVLIGDKVELLLDPYGGKARIVKRLRVG
ncbi:MAG: translation initiation factor IF-1 [Candidatus Pacebacteria bacterium]|nr:translation initiation factor IF-1 [Candidatus Paceibacterota bacterium]